MPDDFSLNQLTSVDTTAGTPAYVETLEAFDRIDHLQELKTPAREWEGIESGARISMPHTDSGSKHCA